MEDLKDKLKIMEVLVPQPFTRNGSAENKIADANFYQSRYQHDIFSLSYISSKLIYLVHEFKNGNIEKEELIYFLKMIPLRKIERLKGLGVELDYLNEVIEYITSLLNVFDINDVRDNFENTILNIYNRLHASKFDLEKLISELPRNMMIQRKTYGAIISISNQVDCIFIKDHMSFKDEEHTKRSVVFIKDIDPSNESFSNLFLVSGVLHVIPIGLENNFKCYSSIDSFNVFKKDIDESIRLIEKYDYNNEIINDFEKMKVILMKVSDSLYGIKGKINPCQSSLIGNAKNYASKIHNKINDLCLFNGQKHSILAKNISCHLKALEDDRLFISDVEKIIHHNLSVIKKNKFLYRRRGKGDLLMEENISAILKSLIEANLPYKRFSVVQEQINASGFSDIEIKYKNNTISIIEAKLIKSGTDVNTINRSITKGVEQLYNRYSNSTSHLINSSVNLSLILFCVDYAWSSIREIVSKCLSEYSVSNSVIVEVMPKHNENVVSVLMSEEATYFGSRIRKIDIIVAVLEDSPDKDRNYSKSYDKKKKKT